MKNWSRFSFFAVAILWGSSFAFQKQLLVAINPYTFTFWNFCISGVFLLALALYKRSALTYRLKEGILLGLLLSGLEILQMVGLHLSTSANTVFISNVGMLLIPYGGWVLFRHRVSRKNNVALVMAIVGMYLLVGGITGIGWGEVYLLGSAVMMALYFLYAERFGAEKSSHLLALLVQQFLTTTVACALVILCIGDSFAIAGPFVAPLLWQIVVFTTVPYMLVQWASKWADEMIAAVYDGVAEPLVGGLVSWVFFAEPATRLNVLGGVLMVVAFVFANIFSNKHHQN